MLPVKNRIKKKKDFERIFKNGHNFKGPFLVFKISKNGLGQNRFGFVVSQKVSKKAVVRNKVRRRLVAIVKKIDNFKDDIDCVIIAKPGIEKREISEIEGEIKNIFKKAGAISK